MTRPALYLIAIATLTLACGGGRPKVYSADKAFYSFQQTECARTSASLAESRACRRSVSDGWRVRHIGYALAGRAARQANALADMIEVSRGLR